MAIVQSLLTYGSVIYFSWGTLNTTGLVSGPGGWQVTNSGRTIEFIVQNSSNCGGPNPNIQTGVAQATFVTGPTAYQFIPVLSGRGEAQDAGFERMTLSLNGVDIVRAASAGGNLGCAPGTPVNITTLVPGPYILNAGTTNTFTLTFTTGDGSFHVDCYYRCELQFVSL
jgi:hypothetical protein